jgi:hypothetical protein
MPGDFRVTTDMSQREMIVTCEPCQESIHIGLSAEGFTRLLALFAGRHDHGDGAEQRIELRSLRIVGDEGGEESAHRADPPDPGDLDLGAARGT